MKKATRRVGCRVTPSYICKSRLGGSADLVTGTRRSGPQPRVRDKRKEMHGLRGARSQLVTSLQGESLTSGRRDIDSFAERFRGGIRQQLGDRVAQGTWAGYPIQNADERID